MYSSDDEDYVSDEEDYGVGYEEGGHVNQKHINHHHHHNHKTWSGINTLQARKMEECPSDQMAGVEMGSPGAQFAET